MRNSLAGAKTRRALLSAAALAALLASTAANAADKCPADPQLLASNIQSSDLENRFGPVSAPTRPLKMAYVTQKIDDPFWTEVQQGLKSETSRLGVTLTASAPTNRLSESEQLAVAQAALATNPDVLLLTAINATNLKSVIDEANSRGIPTVSINLKAEGVRVHIGTDHVALGAKAAEFLHEYLPNGGEVAQIEGEVSSPYRIERVKGFTEGLKAYPNLTLVASIPADWERTKGAAVTLPMMAAHPNIKGIYGNADVMILGAMDSLKKLGRLDDVVLVGTDGVLPAKQAIEAGELEGTTAQFPVKEGILAVQTGIRLLGCQQIPGWVVSPQSVMTSKSVGDYATN